MLPVKSRSARLRFAGVFGDRFALLLERLRIAGHRLGREVVVRPAVGAAAEDFPDQQAAARLKHADISRGVGIPPRADQGRPAEAAGVVHRQPIIGAGHVVGVGEIDRLVVVEHQVAGRLLVLLGVAGDAAPVEDRLDVAIVLDVLDPLFESGGPSGPRCPTACRTGRSAWWSRAACFRSGRRSDNRASPPRCP